MKTNTALNVTCNIQHSSCFLRVCGLFQLRGGFYLKPIRPFDATRFVQAELIPLTINTPFQMMATVGNKTAEVPQMAEQ
jgi:hypothetical protein